MLRVLTSVNFMTIATAKLGVLLLACLLVSVQVHAQIMAQSNERPTKAQTILVSVHPMALLVKSAWPRLSVSSLVSANQSPHDFVLKPSDMKRIVRSDAVVWMGKGFEPYLQKVLRDAEQVDLSESIHTSELNHEKHDQHQVEDDHSKHNHDPHLWLDPNMILTMLAQIQNRLSLPEPTVFIDAYKTWQQVAMAQLMDHKSTGFVSFHDAFREWIDTYELNQLAVVTNNPEKPVGTRHVIKVRNILASGKAKCLFVEPQFQSRIVPKLHKGLDIEVIKIDPMASAYSISDAQFIDFYQELLSKFTQCFSE